MFLNLLAISTFARGHLKDAFLMDAASNDYDQLKSLLHVSEILPEPVKGGEKGTAS